jgi:hypothetical protein
MLSLGGCVPHPPEAPAPFSLSLDDRGLAMTLCFGPAAITRLAVDVRESSSGGWTDWSPLVETADAVLIPFDVEESLPLQVAIPSTSYQVWPGAPLPQGESSIAVYIAFQYDTGRSGYHNESFFVESEAELAAGGYLYSDGTIHSSPCAMASARR